MKESENTAVLILLGALESAWRGFLDIKNQLAREIRGASFESSFDFLREDIFGVFLEVHVPSVPVLVFWLDVKFTGERWVCEPSVRWSEEGSPIIEYPCREAATVQELADAMRSCTKDLAGATTQVIALAKVAGSPSN